MILYVVLFVTVLLAYLVRQYLNVWQYSEKFPGMPTLPIIGNGHQLGSNPNEYLMVLMNCIKGFKFEAFRMWLGPQLFVIITNPKDVEEVLNTNKFPEKFDDYRFLHPWIGKGLITSSGTHWFSHRKLITPSFHFKILNDFHVTIKEGANRLAEHMESFADAGKTFDIQGMVNLATLDVICETAMGVKVDALNDSTSALVKAFHDISFCVYQRIFSAWKRFDLLFPLSNDYTIHTNALNILLTLNKDVIHKRKQYLISDNVEKSPSAIEDDLTSSNKKRMVFLDTLLTATVDGVSLSDEEISDEVSTFVFAGHDTTASAISFFLYHLSLYPVEQQKVFDEQLEIFGDDIERDATYQEVQEMRYLDMFFKESQRLIPAVGFIGRQVKQTSTLGDKVVPAGTSIGVLLYAMGHNPEVFTDPHIFDPERFSTEARLNKNPYEYVPFSVGSRNCIGQKFAVLEVRTTISRLVRKFEILPADVPFEPKMSVTTTTSSLNGVLIRLKRRVPA